jgi:WD40 repeat protein
MQRCSFFLPLLLAVTPSAPMIFSSNCSAESFKIQAATTTIHSVALSPDGQLLCAGDTMGGVKIWDTSTRKIITSLKETQTKLTVIYSVGFSPDGRLLQTTDWSNSVTEIWDCRTWKPTTVIDQISHPRYTIFTSDARLLTVGGYPKTIRHWDIAQNQSLAEFKTGIRSSCEIALNERANRVAIVSNPATLMTIWEIEKGKIREVELRSRPVMALAFITDDTCVCSEMQGRIWTLDVATGRVVSEGRLASNFISIFAPSKGNADRLIAGANHSLSGFPGEIVVLDTKSLQTRRSMPTDAAIHAIDYCPKTNTIAAGCSGGTIYLWTPED